MKYKAVALCVTLLLSLTLLAGCNNDPVSVPELESPSPSPSASATPTPTLSPSATPTPTTTIDPVQSSLIPSINEGPADPTLVTSFKALGKESTLILRGKFVKKLAETYNAIRSMDDGADPDPLYICEQEQYEFFISEVYKMGKNDKFKAGDTIIVNTPLTETYKAGAKSKQHAQYLDMNLDEESVVFLTTFSYNPKRDVYQPETSIYCFTLKGDKMFARCYDEKLLKDWNTDVGIPIANMKKDLDIK